MGTANYISQLLTKIKTHIDNNALIAADLNTPLSAMNRSSKQNINKQTRGKDIQNIPPLKKQSTHSS